LRNVRIRKCESCQILARRRPQGNPIDATFHTVCKIYGTIFAKSVFRLGEAVLAKQHGLWLASPGR
jgi:hypothetical protein